MFKIPDRSTLAARCHEIQVGLQDREVPDFEALPLVGMAVRLSLHLRGLPLVDFETLKLVCSHFLAIPRLAVRGVVEVLDEVEFVRLQTEGKTIKGVLPTVPYYEDLFDGLGEYAETEADFNEAEQLGLYIANRLSSAPANEDALMNDVNAETRLFKRVLDIGEQGTFLIRRRCRGKNILLNPTYFSENAKIFSDEVAARGSRSVKETLDAVRSAQGWPLRLIVSDNKVGTTPIDPSQVRLLKRLAQDGIVKPPSITTTHAGTNYFIFTPTPQGAPLSPTNRDIYERAMAILASIRQGQLLADQYKIRSPGAVLHSLRENLRLRKATTEATQQYRNLVKLGVGCLEPAGQGYAVFSIVDIEENRLALDIAYKLNEEGDVSNLEVDEDARRALQQDQTYVESLISSHKLRTRETVALSDEQELQIEQLFLNLT